MTLILRFIALSIEFHFLSLSSYHPLDPQVNIYVPVNIKILRNSKDSDGDKLSIMGLSPPIEGKIESSSDGIITYTPSESWSGTETFGYSISYWFRDSHRAAN